jgi:hypothetical protein
MIESIGSYTSTPQRVQSTSPSSRLQDPHVLTAIQQTQQRSSGATAPVRVFAVPQTSRSGSSTAPKVPRGSLVDVLA